MSHLRRWGVLSDHNVLAEFARSEVQVDTELRGARDNEMAHLFTDASDAMRKAPESGTPEIVAKVARRNALLKATEGVRDEKSFTTFTAESEQNLVAELEFLKVLHEKKTSGRASMGHTSKVSCHWVVSFASKNPRKWCS